MLDEIYKCKLTVQFLKNGPLGPFLEDLLSIFLEKGYLKNKLKNRITVIIKLCKWLSDTKIELCDLDDQKIKDFIIYRSKQINMKQKGEIVTIRTLVQLLQSKGIIPTTKNQAINNGINKEIETVIENYSKYLINERGLSTSSISHYTHYTRYFLYKLYGVNPISLNKITIIDVNNFFLKHFDTGKSHLVVTSLIPTLRSFFRFLFLDKKISINIASAIQPCANLKNAGLPYFLSQKELDHLIKICKCRESNSKLRNYAILLLLSRIGLRACEVQRLTFNDIDWKNGEIIIKGKGNKKSRLPLLTEIGEALASYIKNERPLCSSRQVFITSRPPIKPLSNSTSISCIVKRALKRANLSPMKKGSHLLRYTFATDCLRRGISLLDIGEILRHQHIDTTVIYAKVDFVKLQSITKMWPEKSYMEGEV